MKIPSDQLSKMPYDVQLLVQNLRPASFGGVPFFVDEVVHTRGTTIKVKKMLDVLTSQGSYSGTAIGNAATIGAGAARAFTNLVLTDEERLETAKKAREAALQKARDLAKMNETEKATQALLDYSNEINSTSADDILSKDVRELVFHGALPPTYRVKAYFLNIAYDPNQLIGSAASSFGFAIDPKFKTVTRSYIDYRDAFLNLCTKPIPQTLQLPSYDAFDAVAGEVTAIYKGNEYGIEYVEVEFFRNDPFVEALRTNTAIAVTSAANDVQLAVSSEMSEALDSFEMPTTLPTETVEKDYPDPLNKKQKAKRLIGEPSLYYIPPTSMDVIEADTRSKLRKLLDALKKASGTVIEKLNDVDALIAGYSNDLSRLLSLPGEFVSSIMNIYKGIVSSFTNPIDAFNYMLDTFYILRNEVPEFTEDAINKFKSIGAINFSRFLGDTFTNAAVFTACSVACSTDYESVEDVLLVKDQIIDMIDEQQEVNGIKSELADTYTALAALKASTAAYLIEVQARLPNVVSINFGKNLPLVVSAYTIYGDSERYVEMSKRNKIIDEFNPKDTLQVLV